MADEGFFDLLSRFQSNRMDDQRCCFQEKNRLSAASVATSSTPPKTMIKCNFLKAKCVFDLTFAKSSFQNVSACETVQQCIPSQANCNLFCVSWAALSTSVVSPHTDEFLDLLASSQSRRLDDQRASFSELPGLRLRQHGSQPVLGHLLSSTSRDLDDDFFDILIKCQVSANNSCLSSWLWALHLCFLLLNPCKEATVLIMCFKMHIDLM